MTALLLVMFGGALGAAGRYAVTLWAARYAATGLPVGTMVVNIAGSLLFGFIWAVTEQRGSFSANTRLLLLSGGMGAFTTFSTFAFDNAHLIQGGKFGVAAFNIGLQNGLGLAAVLGGMALGRLWA